MNVNIVMASGYVIAAGGGFVLGVFIGRSLLSDIRAAIGSVESRLAAVESRVVDAVHHNPGSHPAQAIPAPANAESAAAAQHRHAAAVEKLGQAIEKHAQAIDEHGAATVAAAVELGAHPAHVGAAVPHQS